MQILTFLNEAGGVGKTTAAVTTAAGLAIYGLRVILIDTDPQMGTATPALGIEHEPCFYDFAVRSPKFSDVLRLVDPMRYVVPDEASSVTGELWMMPGNHESRNINSFGGKTPDIFAVLKKLLPLRGWADVVIFDTSPTPSLLNSFLIAATDMVIIPTLLETKSILGVMESEAVIQNYSLLRQSHNLAPIQLLGVLPTMTRMGYVEHSENHGVLVEHFGENKIWEPISRQIVWAETFTAQKSIFAYMPASDAAKNGWRLVDRLMGVMQHAE